MSKAHQMVLQTLHLLGRGFVRDDIEALVDLHAVGGDDLGSTREQVAELDAQLRLSGSCTATHGKQGAFVPNLRPARNQLQVLLERNLIAVQHEGV